MLTKQPQPNAASMPAMMMQQPVMMQPPAAMSAEAAARAEAYRYLAAAAAVNGGSPSQRSLDLALDPPRDGAAYAAQDPKTAQQEAQARALASAYRDHFSAASPEVQRAMQDIVLAGSHPAARSALDHFDGKAAAAAALHQQHLQQQQQEQDNFYLLQAQEFHRRYAQQQQQHAQQQQRATAADDEHTAFQRQLQALQHQLAQEYKSIAHRRQQLNAPSSNATSPTNSTNASPTGATAAGKDRDVRLNAEAIARAIEESVPAVSKDPRMRYAMLEAARNASLGFGPSVGSELTDSSNLTSYQAAAAAAAAAGSMPLRDLSLPQLLSLLPTAAVPYRHDPAALAPPLPPPATPGPGTGQKRAADFAGLGSLDALNSKYPKIIKQEPMYNPHLFGVHHPLLQRDLSGSHSSSGSLSPGMGRPKPRGKLCNFIGCEKLARGKGFCKRHGGGRRCQTLNCLRSARSGSKFCTSHGGGRRCQTLGCTKGAEGATFHCVAHGGGKRCQRPGCTKKDQGSGFCKSHGGGKRCAMPMCTRSVKTGTDLCSSHYSLKEAAAF